MNPATLPPRTRWLIAAAVATALLVGAAADFGAADAASDDRLSAASAPLRKAAAPARARPVAAAPAALSATHVELERLGPAPAAALDEGATGNTFAVASWYVPPPPPPPPEAAPPPPPPQAPPLPFTYLGIYAAAAPVIILSRGDRVYTVSPGEVIDGLYRVDSVVGNAVQLTYLPLNITQSLATGGA